MKIRNVIITSFAIFLLLGFNQTVNSAIINPTYVKDFSSLKAVLVLGTDSEARKQSTIDKMNKIATFFKSKGVSVHKFYDQSSDWNKIKVSAKGANFFVYEGHGSTMGENGTSGGLCLTSMISSKTMIQELQLAKNALVIFKSVCRGAGSSAGDDGDIGLKEAIKRVSNYSKPFFQINAGAYYANNLGDGCVSFLSDFFAGMSIKECFIKSTKTWAKVETNKKYRYDVNKSIGIASTDWGGTATRTTYINGVKKVEKIPNSKSYDIAYVANPNFSIKDMQ